MTNETEQQHEVTLQIDNLTVGHKSTSDPEEKEETDGQED